MKNKIIIVLKIIAGILLVIFGAWLATITKVNIGSLLSKLFGGKVNPTPDPKGLDGLPVGQAYLIKNNINPLRDKTVVELENGVVVKLPAGVVDSDVQKVVVVSQGVVNVIKKGSDDLTGVFDSGASAQG